MQTQQLFDSGTEVGEANKCLEEAEQRWDVIDTDADKATPCKMSKRK